MDNVICVLLGCLLSCSYILVYFYGKSQAPPPIYLQYNTSSSLLTTLLTKENIRLTNGQLKRISEGITGYHSIGFEGKDADV